MLSSKDINNAPLHPGVYKFHDSKGRVLYVGKAANLRARLQSYFRSTPKEGHIQAMLEEASRVDWKETSSEIEALIVESQIIKKERTPYNILMRDDKQYASVAVTKEKFPRLYVTRQRPPFIKTARGEIPVRYIGPFTDASALTATLAYLRRIFPFCTCKQFHDRYCLNYHIGKCPGYCCLKESKWPIHIAAHIPFKTYQGNIRAMTDLLGGKKQTLIKRLKKEMRVLSRGGDWEAGAVLERRLSQMERIFENAKVLHEIEGRDEALTQLMKLMKLPKLPHRIEGYDISNIQGNFATGSMVVFTDGQADKSEYRKFKIRIDGKPDDTAMLKEVLRRRFSRTDWPVPDLLLIDGGKGQLNAAVEAVSFKFTALSFTILSIAKGKQEIFSSELEKPIRLSAMPLSVQNLIRHIDSEAHRFAISYYRKLHRKHSIIAR